MLKEGDGIDIDIEESLKYFKMVLYQDDYETMNQYEGLSLMLNMNDKEVHAESIFLFKVSIDHSNLNVLANLGNINDNPFLKQDLNEVEEDVRMMKEAAEK